MPLAETPPHVEEILGPHPELLAYWREFMARPCMKLPEYSGTVDEYLEPTFLERVVDEHLRVIEGRTEQPGPELVAAIEAVLELSPAIKRSRAENLANPWWRAGSYDYNGIAKYYDPDYLERVAEAQKRYADPFSAESIRRREFMEALEAGGSFLITDKITGDVERLEVEGTASGGAGWN